MVRTVCEEEEEDLFVFHDTIEGPRAPGCVTHVLKQELGLLPCLRW